jgi:uncharacterized protein with NRDE domain
MCLIIFAYKTHPSYRLIIAANRDEFYERPTTPLSFWPENPNLLAGKDLVGGGTWMGISTNGHFAAITNYRSPKLLRQEAPTRGLLVSNFLQTDIGPKNYLEKMHRASNRYNHFNLLVGDGSTLLYYSSIERRIVSLQPGIYGLSNHLLDTTWPKVEKGKAGLGAILSANESTWPASLFELLADQTYPPDNRLPETGVGLEWERILSPLFITSPTYGTRSSTVLLERNDGQVFAAERNYDPDTGHGDISQQIEFNLKLNT